MPKTIIFNIQKSHFSLWARTNLAKHRIFHCGYGHPGVPLLLGGLLKLMKPFGGSWRLLGGFLGFPGASGVKWRSAQNHRFQIKKIFIDGTALFAWAPFGAEGLPLALNPNPDPGAGSLGRALAWRGGLGPGFWLRGAEEQPACLDPSLASWSRNPATRGQGARGGGPGKP